MKAAIALGSNLDGPEGHVKRGFDDIAALPETTDVSTHHVFDFKITRIAHDPAYVADMIRELRATWEQVLEARASPTPVVVPPMGSSPALKGFAFKRFGNA